MDEPNPKPRLDWTWWPVVWGTVSVAATIPVSLVLQLFFPGPPQQQISDMAQKDPALLLVAVVSAPFLETFIGQALPIWIVRLFTRSTVAAIVVSAGLFGGLHLTSGPAAAIGIGLVAGPVFAYTFVRWWRVSFWQAYLVTTLTHVVYNLLAFCLMLISL
jgi:hypothetical protein